MERFNVMNLCAICSSELYLVGMAKLYSYFLLEILRFRVVWHFESENYLHSNI